jgi:hypothetical protein
MSEPPSYASRLRTKARRETTRFIQHKLLTGACVATAVVIVRLALWHFHRLTLTRAEVWITLLTIAGSYGIVVAGAFVVNLFRATGLLDEERADEIAVVTGKLKQKTEEYAVLTEKLKTLDALNKQKEIRIAFAKLMNDGKIVELNMSTSQDNGEFNNVLVPQMVEWVNRAARIFVEFDMDTDARAFQYSGEKPSPEQVKAVTRDYFQQWKQYPMAQLAVYMAKLQEIVERRNL